MFTYEEVREVFEKALEDYIDGSAGIKNALIAIVAKEPDLLMAKLFAGKAIGASEFMNGVLLMLKEREDD